jgi:hypothetical protein
MSETLKIFEDYVQTATGSATTYYTSAEFDAPLALLDQIAVEVRAEQGVPGANPSITAKLQHCANGRSWHDKAGTPEIPSYVLDPLVADNNVRVGLSDGTVPSLSLVRVAITISAAAAAFARVIVKATLNDVRENAFARHVGNVIAQIRKQNPCKIRIQGGRPFGVMDDGPNGGRQKMLHDLGRQIYHSPANGPHSSWPKLANKYDGRILGYSYDGEGHCTPIHHHYFKLDDSASLCVTYDGKAVVEKPGTGALLVGEVGHLHGGGSSGGGGNC